MAEDHEEQVAVLRRLFEAELDRNRKVQFGCWPLLVGLAGVLLGVGLLLAK